MAVQKDVWSAFRTAFRPLFKGVFRVCYNHVQGLFKNAYWPRTYRILKRHFNELNNYELD